MGRLARDLRLPDRQVEVLNYVTAIESFDRIVRRVRDCLASLAPRGTYAVIGHSLGGLLLRAALADASSSFVPPAHLIMLGTPNRPPRLAGRYRRLWPYRWINGECGQLLARPDFFAGLPPVSVPYTIIAGTGGRCGGAGPFATDPNDGVVAVSETLVSPSDQPITFPVRHTFMMNDRRVRGVIHKLLERASG
jgi:hypothetical protein